MIGSHFRVRSAMGDAPFSHVGEKEAGSNANDVMVQNVKSKAQAEFIRLRQIGATERARLAAQSGVKWSQWAPLAIVGGIAAVGIVALVIRSRRKRP